MNSSQSFTHSEKVLRTLYQYQRQAKHCDVIIVTTNDLSPVRRNEPSTSAADAPRMDDKMWWLPCHKIVLRANSPFFERKFTEWVPGIPTPLRPLHVILPKIRASSMKAIVEFCYQGEMAITHHTIVTLMEDAKALEFNDAVQFCEEFVSQPLTTSNCIQILRCSRNLGYLNTSGDSFDFLVDNFFTIAASPDSSFHEEMNHEILAEVFQCDDLQSDNEDDLLKILKTWVSFDPQNRVHLQSNLFQYIRHGSLTDELLKTIARNREDTLMKNETSRVFIIKALLGELPSAKRSSPNPGKILAFTINGKHEKLDSSTRTWSSWLQKPCNEGFGIAILKDNLLLIGSTDNERNWETEIYNVRLNAWRKGPELQRKRWHFATCVSDKNNCVYVVGGSTDSNILDSVEALQCSGNGDPSGQWRSLPAMTSARNRHAAAFIGDKIFITGGYNGKDEALARVESYDVREAEWATCQPMNEKRRGHAMVTYNDNLFVFGGYNGHNLTSSERYDPELDLWVQIASMRIARAYCDATVFNKKMYLIGGRPAGSSCEIYNPDNDIFSDGPGTKGILNFCRCVSWYDTTQKTRSRKTSLSTVATAHSSGCGNGNQMSEDSTNPGEEFTGDEKMENKEQTDVNQNTDVAGTSQ